MGLYVLDNDIESVEGSRSARVYTVTNCLRLTRSEIIYVFRYMNGGRNHG